jgi:hypothetical protein
MRFLAYLLAIVVLFALSDSSVAQDRYSATEAPKATAAAKPARLRLLTWPGKVRPQATQASAERPLQGSAPAVPAPLDPQFFADGSTDLAAPPPEPTRTVTTSNGRIARVVPDDPPY